MSTDLLIRTPAVQACFDRFVDKPFEWGKRDCVKMAAHLLHNIHHPVGLLKGVKYTTELGAYKALKKAGFSTLFEAVDSLGLPQINPAEAVIGDIVGLDGNDTFGGTLSVCFDHMKVIGYQEGHDVAVRIQLSQAARAWRV